MAELQKVKNKDGMEAWYSYAVVSMPFRAFGDSDVQVLAVYGFFLHVSMPFRAFGDSDWT